MKPRRRTFPPHVYAEILARQRNRCACGCGKKLDDVTLIRWDHVIPLELGGADAPENLQALLRGHHKDKTTREAKARAKAKRIQEKGGLTRRPMSARDRELARIIERRGRP